MKPCDSCGKPQAYISMGGSVLCRECDPIIRDEMEKLRADGKPVNVLNIARRRYKEEFSGGNYLLRDYPEELWQAARHRAVDEGLSMRDLILKSLRKYLGD